MSLSPKDVLKPGWLVIPDIHNHGCSHYKQKDRHENVDENRVLTGDWNTVKRIDNIDEHQAIARTIRDARKLVEVCGLSISSGVYVAYEQEELLAQALIEARKIIDTHNSVSTFTRITGGFLTFKISGENEVVANALIKQATFTLAQLVGAIGKADVKTIRETLRRASRLETMFGNEQAEKLTAAFNEAKTLARQITQASKKNEEGLIDWTKKINDVDRARIAFVEIEVDDTAELRLPPLELMRQIEVE